MIKPLLLVAACLSGPGLKIKVDGEGYLRFIRDGRAVYAKEAALEVANGKLGNAAGDSLLPAIPISPPTASLDVDLQGNIYALSGSTKAKIGQLVLATFSASVALQPQDVVLISSDRPHLGTPGDESLGVIRTVTDFLKSTKTLSANVVKGASAERAFVIPDELTARLLPTSKEVTKSTLPPVGRTADPNAHGVQITVQERSVEEGDHILLGDIAQLDGDPAVVAQLSKVDLGDTPPTGIKRIIDRARILGRVRYAGFKPENLTLVVPAAAEVRRKGQTIPNSDFVVTATQALLSGGGQSGTWQSTDSFADLEVPSGKLELKAESVSGVDSGNASVIVAIYIGENRFNSRTVHLHLKETVPPVQVGSAIKVILTAGKAEVEVPGVARTSGHLGQSIQVEVQVGNPPVKTMHTGIVVATGTVQVKL